MLKRPTREPRPPARRAYAPEGTEKKPVIFRSIGVMQRSHLYDISCYRIYTDKQNSDNFYMDNRHSRSFLWHAEG
ncbi:MAG: hypothetical protein ACQEQO_02680 [Thermodesulfobacteriota bacterium]